jgi:hypothetical protein
MGLSSYSLHYISLGPRPITPLVKLFGISRYKGG